MSYIINKTDGSILTEIVDGSIDQTSTDLTLIGKNSSSYGEFLNENLIKLLENFASSSAPNNPIEGQLWYDTSEGRLKIYDGTSFKVSGGTIVSNSTPSSIAAGDLWVDSFRQQLYFSVDGAGTNILAGPQYTAQQGISGFSVVDVIDTNSINHTIVIMYVAQVAIGCYSKTSFTPATPIPGFSGNIEVGFNVGDYSGIKFNVPVSQADTLLAADGTQKTAESFLSSSDAQTLALGTLTIQNETPLILGAASQTELRVSNSAFQINSNVSNQNFQINLLNQSGFLPALIINATTQRTGLYRSSPEATLDVGGDVIVRGDLTVNGNITSINSVNIEIEDILISLGKTENPSNATADGGGILIEAGTDVDKTFLWNASSSSWQSSENINVASGKGFLVNGFPVINQTSLGVTVASAPGLTSIGTLDSLRVDYININDSTISYVNDNSVNGSITLVPKGNGTVNVSSKRIADLADPVDNNDAVNLVTLDTTIKSAPLGLSANTTGLSDEQVGLQIIGLIYPVAEHEPGTICRLWSIDTSVAKQYSIRNNVWSFDNNL